MCRNGSKYREKDKLLEYCKRVRARVSVCGVCRVCVCVCVCVLTFHVGSKNAVITTSVCVRAIQAREWCEIAESQVHFRE